jgi:hypothetical protein
MAYLVIAKEYLVISVTRIVQTQIAEIPDTDKPDAWWGLVDQKQPRLLSLAQTLTSLASVTHTIRDVSIYGRLAAGERRRRLYLDQQDVLRSEVLDESVVRKLKLSDRDHFIQSDSDMYLGRRQVAMFVNITSPADRGNTSTRPSSTGRG